MQSDSHRLWKQIGNQAHRMQQVGKRVSETAQNEGKLEKRMFQQFERCSNQSEVIEELNTLQFSNINQLPAEQGLSYRARKHSEQYDYLELVLKELENQKSEESLNKIKASIKAQNNYTKFTVRCRNQHQNIKLIVHDCKNQFVNLQAYVRQELRKSQQIQLKAMQEFSMIEEMLQLKISMLKKQNISKDQQLKIIKQLYQEKSQMQKNLQLELESNKLRQIQHKQQIKTLQKLNRDLVLEKQKIQKEFQDQAEIIFDAEQKLLSFDMKVQQKVNEIIERNQLKPKIDNLSIQETNSKNQKFHQGASRFSQNIPLHNTERETISEEENAEEYPYYYLDGVGKKMSTDYFGSTFCSDKDCGLMNMSSSVKKLPTKNPIKPYRQSPRNSNKSVSMKTSLNTISHTPIHNHSQNLSRRIALNERQRYSPYEKQQFSPYSSQFYKKQFREADNEREKRPQIDKISQKLNNIKVKIQKQINSILHY